MNNEPSFCTNCRKPLPPDGPLGLCPECLMKSGFSTGTEPGVTTMEFVPPTVAELSALFPQFQVLGLIGKGGMGAVYQARQPGLDRLIALKILPPQAGNDPGFAERFNREARALARLNHPNIVSVHDFGRAGDYYYLVMEFVDGMNLRQRERTGRMPPAQALQIIPQICDALQFAHEEGIVHRDIKPENILIDKKGRVKIADFGIAKMIGVTENIRLTGARDIVGTPHYMAPEQVEKPNLVDHRADIYSLGVVFYELLTGELPLGRFSPPSTKVKVDVRLDEVVLRSLEKAPERRYQQANQMKTAVQTIAAQPPLISGHSPAANVPPAAKRGKSVALVFALIFLAVLVVVAGGMILAVHVLKPRLLATVANALSQASSNSVPSATPPAPELRYHWTNGMSLVYAVELVADKENETETLKGNLIYNVQEANGDTATISYRNQMGLPQHHAKPGKAAETMFLPRLWPDGIFHTPRQVRINSDGSILEGSGDGRQLPQALGNVEDIIFEPLPPRGKTEWSAGDDCTVTLTHFVPVTPMSGFGRMVTTSYAAYEKAGYRAVPAEPGLVTIHKQYELKTRETTDGQPRLQLTGEGTITFDAGAGLARAMEFTGMLTETTSNITERVPLTLKYHLLTGQDRTNALTPSASAKVQPKVLTAAELRNALIDLKSGDSGRRQMATSILAGAKPAEPKDDVVKAMIPALSDTSWAVRQNTARALGVWDTDDGYAPLVKALDDPEFSVRWTVIDSLSHWTNAATADVLAKHMAHGTDVMQTGNALRAIGAPAEEAVAGVLEEKDQQVRYEACRILKDIGTEKSVPALTTAAGDRDGITAILAQEALKAIDRRK